MNSTNKRTKKLGNRIAIVTGSDSGIGHATAIAFAKEGANIIITRHKDYKGAEETKKAVENEGQQAIVVDLDQRNPQDVQRVFKESKERLGIPTILVNNAGTDSTGKEVKDMSIEEWDDEMRTNLYGPYYFCKFFLSNLENSSSSSTDRATIINITSVHQEVPRAGASGYCVTKGGLRNLTRCLALELAEENITVNNIAPGMVLTPFNQQALVDPEVRKKQVQSIPIKRAAQPEEIANAAVFLASEYASYIHGTTLFIDGGLMQNQGQGA
jgi:glucose 1-dehydrogenase